MIFIFSYPFLFSYIFCFCFSAFSFPVRSMRVWLLWSSAARVSALTSSSDSQRLSASPTTSTWWPMGSMGRKLMAFGTAWLERQVFDCVCLLFCLPFLQGWKLDGHFTRHSSSAVIAIHIFWVILRRCWLIGGCFFFICCHIKSRKSSDDKNYFSLGWIYFETHFHNQTTD